MIKAIAIDDEPLALKIIQTYSEKVENLFLEKVFTVQSDAQKYLNKFPVDLVFLDINMPQKNGMDFSKSISQNTKIIFTTAYSEFAVNAFEVNALDYLVKPFSFERFLAAVEKLKISVPQNEARHLMIRADYKLHKINYDDIVLIEGLDDYIQIHLKNRQKITARSSMKNITEKLSEKEFIRVHRSYIVPIKSIHAIVSKSIQIDDFIIPIGDTYKDDLIRFLEE